jgi:hypothetical protein
MDEELRRRLELEHIRLIRKPIEDQVFASDEPITTLRHIFKGVEDTVLEYNAEYVTEPVRGLIAEWKDPDGFLVRDGKGNSIELQLAADRRSILQVQNPTGKTKAIALSAQLDGHVCLEDLSGHAKVMSKVAGEILIDLLFPEP